MTDVAGADKNPLDFERLSDLQKGILKEIADPAGKNIRQVAIALDKHAPAVHTSLQLLIENKMVKAEDPKEGVAKILTLTQKGFAYAVVYADFDYEQWVRQHGNIDDVNELHTLSLLVLTEQARKRLYRTIFSFIIRNNLIDEKSGNLTLSKSLYYRRLVQLEIFQEAARIMKESPSSINPKEIKKMQDELKKVFNLEALQIMMV